MITTSRKVWIFSLIFLYIFTWLASIILIFVGVNIRSEMNRDIIHAIIGLAVSMEIYLLGYFALSNPVIFVDEIDYEKKYPYGQSLSNQDTDGEFSLLQKTLVKERLYQDNSLTLNDISLKTGIKPAARISQIIFKHLNINFCDYINSLRLEEVKRLLADNSKQSESILAESILELAYEAGFNSKATFNRIFKEKTGITPREFRRKKNITA